MSNGSGQIELEKQVVVKDSDQNDTVIKDTKKITRPKKQIEKPAEITIGAGATLPIPGKAYSTIKVWVSLKLPCEEESIDKTSEFASRKVQEYLEREMDLALGE